MPEQKWKDVTLAGFSSRTPCRVYRAEVELQSTTRAKEIPFEEFPTQNSSVVVEYEDYHLLAEGNDSVVRVAFHNNDARELCISLIKALANGGDNIAFKIVDYINTLKEEQQEYD